MDIFSESKRSEIMAKVKNKDSKIEIVLRKALWAKGFRYRKNSNKHFGKPDIILPKRKTVIFVDSCFWHCCPKHYEFPATRQAFWRKKILGNRERDKKVNRHYKKINWDVIRVWEHEMKDLRNLRKIAEKIIRKMKQ